MNLKEHSYQFLDRPETIVRGNVTNQVADNIRHAIVTLRMKPGEGIDKIAICEQMGVSRFPVSEALTRLQTEGLVDILPQRGTRVSLIKISTMREFMLIRRAVEAEIARAFTMAPDPEMLKLLHQILEEQIKAVKSNNTEKFHQTDNDFHAAMLSSLNFSHVQTIISNARSNLERTNRLLDSRRRFDHTLDEHQIILDAVIAGKAEQAAEAMRAHMDAVIESVMQIAAKKPHLFADGDQEFTQRQTG